ncbi:ABC transporter permease [Kallipyga gabonensis]|uniref:ABC transporter permease n=1 Tax=Kallipyga gabonensis TaxID=1686287 RepID=UPI0006B435BB|nr:ABC transporter permease [Kallipyga gabonensis]
MKIFKLFFKIVSRNKGVFFLYFVIFLSLVFLTTKVTKQDKVVEYTQAKIVLDDQDQTPLSKGLVDLYRMKDTVIDKTLTRQEMVDGAYNYEFALGLIIPKGFSDSFYKGGQPSLEVVGNLYEKNQVLVQAQADQYLSFIRVFQATQKDPLDADGEDYAIRQSLKIADSQPLGKILDEEGRNDAKAVAFIGPLGFMDYGILSMALSFLGIAIMAIEKDTVRRRIQISGYSEVRTLGEILLASFLLMSVLWLFFLVTLTIIEGSLDLYGRPQIRWALLSSFVHMLSATSLSLFCVYLLFQKRSFKFFQTIFTLLVAFASGVFIDRSFVDTRLHAMSSIFPTYWNIEAISDSVQSTHFGPTQVASFERSILVMVLMMAAYFVLTLILRRYRLRPQK